MYEIIISKKAHQEFKRLPKGIKERVVAVLERIKMNPYRFARKLAGNPAYRVRVGKHRIILDINENKKRLEVLRIGHRERIYG